MSQKKCQACKMFEKPPPRAITSLALANQFQETVELSTTFYEVHIVFNTLPPS